MKVFAYSSPFNKKETRISWSKPHSISYSINNSEIFTIVYIGQHLARYDQWCLYLLVEINLVNLKIIINRLLWKSKEKRWNCKIKIQDTERRLPGYQEIRMDNIRKSGIRTYWGNCLSQFGIMVRFNAPCLLFSCFALMLSCRIFA